MLNLDALAEFLKQAKKAMAREDEQSALMYVELLVKRGIQMLPSNMDPTRLDLSPYQNPKEKPPTQPALSQEDKDKLLKAKLGPQAREEIRKTFTPEEIAEMKAEDERNQVKVASMVEETIAIIQAALAKDGWRADGSQQFFLNADRYVGADFVDAIKSRKIASEVNVGKVMSGRAAGTNDESVDKVQGKMWVVTLSK